MPFAQLPSSPGFVPPQAPDWTRFGAQANEFIQRGGEMRAQAGHDFADSISKAAQQITGILEENSPEGKMAKALKAEALKAQIGLYQEYKSLTPEQRAQTFEFKNGMLQYRDALTNYAKMVGFKNSLKRGVLLDRQINASADPEDERLRSLAGASATTPQQATSGYSNTALDVSNIGQVTTDYGDDDNPENQ